MCCITLKAGLSDAIAEGKVGGGLLFNARMYYTKWMEMLRWQFLLLYRFLIFKNQLAGFSLYSLI